jgi:hypothetical protein
LKEAEMVADEAAEAERTSGATVGIVGVPPLIASAAVFSFLKGKVPDEALGGIATAAGSVVAWVMWTYSRRRESLRAKATIEDMPDRDAADAALARSMVPVALLAVLAGLVFTLVDAVGTVASYGLLLYSQSGSQALSDMLSGADNGAEAYGKTVIYGLGFTVILGIPLSVWFAHRLRRAAGRGLYLAVGIDVVLTLAINYIVGFFDSQYALWFLIGTIAWLAAVMIGRWLATRTQYQFDMARAAWLRAGVARDAHK